MHLKPVTRKLCCINKPCTLIVDAVGNPAAGYCAIAGSPAGSSESIDCQKMDGECPQFNGTSSPLDLLVTIYRSRMMAGYTPPPRYEVGT